MPVMNMFPGGSTLQIPLDSPTSFSATAGNAQVELTWTDPLDKYATPEGEVSETGDQLVSEWDHTVLVRKTGSQPAGPNDGTVVVSSSVRNQYQSTAYVDSGLTNDTTYYYGVFAYNKDGVASSGAFVNAMPKAGTPLSELTEGTIIKIIENGSPVEFYLAKHNYEPDLNGQGRELVVRKDCYSNQTWGNSTEYANNAMDSWLNSTYKSVLSASVQSLIATTKFYYSPGDHDTIARVLDRSVFILSPAEFGLSGSSIVVQGTSLPNASTLRVAYMAGIATDQWTRSPTLSNYMDVAYVGTTGGLRYNIYDAQLGARPIFTLPSDTLVGADLVLVED